MKFRQISYLMIGLASCGALAKQATTPATTPPVSAPPAASIAPVVAPEKGQLSYALGIYYAQGMTNDMMRGKGGLEPKTDLDLGMFLAGFTNMMAGTPTTMKNEEVTNILAQEGAYQKEWTQEAIKKEMATGPENKAAGEKFMDAIAATTGVKKLASGVVYKVIKDGEIGESPGTNDMVTMSFRATLIDGTEVWKLDRIPAPVTHPLIPPGVTEALTMMKTNSHWTIYLPYTQAFGDKPAIQTLKHDYKVGPYSALIFDLELEGIQHKPPPPPTRPPGAGGPMMQPGARGPGPMVMPPGTVVSPPAANVSPQVTSSGIVRVPSGPELEKGEKPRVMTQAEIEAAIAAAKQAAQTNSTAPK